MRTKCGGPGGPRVTAQPLDLLGRPQCNHSVVLCRALAVSDVQQELSLYAYPDNRANGFLVQPGRRLSAHGPHAGPIRVREYSRAPSVPKRSHQSCPVLALHDRWMPMCI